MDTHTVTRLALLLPAAAASVHGLPWGDLGRTFLLLTVTGVCYTVGVLVSPTQKCPECKGGPHPHGLCPRCLGLRRVPRFGARLIHRAFRILLRRLTERRRDRITARRRPP